MSVREAAEELVTRAAAAGRRGRVLTSDEASMLTDEVTGYPGWLAELLAQVPLCGLELGWPEPELGEPQWLEWADANAAKSESVEFYPGLAILPAGYVNVAADAGGGSDPFFISVHEGPDPALYQIYHDVGSEAEDILRDGRKLVAPSLSAFFKSALIRPKG
ncbi:hypothetical protein [Zavarzinella formosa]|uniref:hypothetical protein n=1 Tax=Zavarzinella formosa TaxID=360055 RepID=UPI0002E4F146|nr:hypothetical protein [Zavarzinella formosa]